MCVQRSIWVKGTKKTFIIRYHYLQTIEENEYFIPYRPIQYSEGR
jgi:hypothetical protein